MFLYFCLFNTPIGACGISWSKKRIVSFQLPEATDAETRRRLIERNPDVDEVVPPKWVNHIIVRIRKHLEGLVQDFSDIPLDLRNSPLFYRRVYQATRTIAAGQTKTYGEIAKQIHSSGAARAVGRALGRNPIGLIVPCHRVVASGKKVGGFSAFGGLNTKTKLLEIEKAPVP